MYRERSPLRIVLAAAIIVLAMLVLRSASIGDSVALEHFRLRGASVHVVTADLNDSRVSVQIGLPAKGIAHSERFEAMVRRHGPIAAVTGTYFCTRSLIPVGTLVVDGKTVHVNCIGNTVCFLESNHVRFLDTAKGQNCDVTGARYALRTGPRLLNSGEYALNPRREGFRDPGVFGRHARMALGLTRHNKLLLVSISTPVTFGRTASIMKALGAVEAICLDGGSSSAMYYRGRLVRRPGRALTNIIEVSKAPVVSGTYDVCAPAGVVIASVALEGSVSVVATLGWPAETPTSPDWAAYHHEAILDPFVLSLAKCGHPLFPVKRSWLSA